MDVVMTACGSPRTAMLRLFANVLKDDTGATAIEYALIAGLVALAAISAITNIGKNLSTTFNTVSTKL
jgi:pilus assembly protein Flp/PilA